MKNTENQSPINEGYTKTKITKKDITTMLHMRNFSFKNNIEVYYNKQNKHFMIVERKKFILKIIYTLLFPILILLSIIDWKNTLNYFKDEIWCDDLYNGNFGADIISPIEGEDNNLYWNKCNELMLKK